MGSADLAERPHERLRRMLDRAGITNKQVAARTGAAAETVSRWRNGVQAIDDDDLRTVVEMLGERGIAVTRSWIRYGDEPEEHSARRPA